MKTQYANYQFGQFWISGEPLEGAARCTAVEILSAAGDEDALKLTCQIDTEWGLEAMKTAVHYHGMVL